MSNEFQIEQMKAFDKVFSGEILSDNVALRHEFETLLSFIGDLENKSVLDLGCGFGRNGLRLAKYARQVTGYDISPVGVAKANEYANQLHIDNFVAYQNDFSAPDSSVFDVIVCVNMLHHATSMDDILKNIYISLKPGGKLIIFENNPLNPLFYPFFIAIGQLKAHLNWQFFQANKYTLRNKCEKNGFLYCEVRRHGFLPTMLYNISSKFIKLNNFINKVPIVNEFAAFHLIKMEKPLDNTI